MVVSQVFISAALKAKGPDPRGRTRVTSDIYGVVVVVVIDEPGGGFTTTVAGCGLNNDPRRLYHLLFRAGKAAARHNANAKTHQQCNSVVIEVDPKI
jgi:hypothetical protein